MLIVGGGSLPHPNPIAEHHHQTQNLVAPHSAWSQYTGLLVCANTPPFNKNIMEHSRTFGPNSGTLPLASASYESDEEIHVEDDEPPIKRARECSIVPHSTPKTNFSIDAIMGPMSTSSHSKSITGVRSPAMTSPLTSQPLKISLGGQRSPSPTPSCGSAASTTASKEGEKSESRRSKDSPRSSSSSSSSSGPSNNPHAHLLKNKFNCEELSKVECRLDNKELWDKFHDLGTEMIITKTGR